MFVKRDRLDYSSLDKIKNTINQEGKDSKLLSLDTVQLCRRFPQINEALGIEPDKGYLNNQHFKALRVHWNRFKKDFIKSQDLIKQPLISTPIMDFNSYNPNLEKANVSGANYKNGDLRDSSRKHITYFKTQQKISVPSSEQVAVQISGFVLILTRFRKKSLIGSF